MNARTPQWRCLWVAGALRGRAVRGVPALHVAGMSQGHVWANVAVMLPHAAERKPTWLTPDGEQRRDISGPVSGQGDLAR